MEASIATIMMGSKKPTCIYFLLAIFIVHLSLYYCFAMLYMKSQTKVAGLQNNLLKYKVLDLIYIAITLEQGG